VTTRSQNLRSSTPGQTPAAGTRQPGEIWMTFPDIQLGYIDASRNAQKLIAVRFFSTAANYVAGDFVIQGGKLYFAKGAVPAGAFNAGQWSQVAALTDIPAIYVLPIASTSVLGGVKVDGITVKADAAGVLTAAGLVTVSATPPSPVQNGALWYDLTGGQLYTWVNDGTSSQWVIAVNSGGSSGASITIGDTPPVGPLTGALWFDSVGGQLYVWYNDGGSNQWVPTTNQIGGGGGYQLSKGVTDGSDAAAGQIGEIISSVVTTGVPLTTNVGATVASISLSPGDWDVTGDVYLTGTAAISSVFVATSFVAATLPTVPLTGINVARSQIVTPTPMSTVQGLPVRTCRVSVTATTPYYLIGYAVFASGACSATGVLWARRAR
jgi:hypothetical protein